MPEMAQTATPAQAWFTDKILMGYKPREYARSLLTPANAVAALILAIGIPVSIYRFMYGLGLRRTSRRRAPGLVDRRRCRQRRRAGGRRLHGRDGRVRVRAGEIPPVVRPAVLTGALGYLFVVIGLLFDLGLPWHLPVPMVCRSAHCR